MSKSETVPYAARVYGTTQADEARMRVLRVGTRGIQLPNSVGYLSYYATIAILLRLVQSIPSPKLEDGKIGLAEVDKQRLKQEVVNRMAAELEEAREHSRQEE